MTISASAPLRVPTFRWFFLSRSVNLVGSTMAPVALAFAVLEISDSPGALGSVLAAYSTALVVFMLAGGVIADRYGRARVIQAGNLLSGAVQGVIAALVLTGTAQLWHLVLLSAISGAVAAVSKPALMAVVPQLVPHEHLQAANVLLSMTRALLAVLGPSVSATLVVTVGPGWALAVDAVTWLLAAALLAPVTLPSPRPGDAATSVLVELREGWHLFRTTTWLWLVVLAFSVLNALYEGGLNTLGPVLAGDSPLGRGGWGLMMSAQAVGLVVMTVVMMRVTLQRPLLFGMLGCAAFGAPMVALGLSPTLGVALVAGFVSGMGIELFSLGWRLAMQEHIPEHLLSRASSYDSLFSFLAIPVGQLSVGTLAAAFGTREVILAAGVAYVALSLATLAVPVVRRLPRVTHPPVREPAHV